METGKLKMRAVRLLFGHILNPLWHSRLQRRRRRGEVIAGSVDAYLERYAGAFASIGVPSDRVPNIIPTAGAESGGAPKIHTLWLQGEENAPRIVRSCIESMRLHSAMDVEVLDAVSVLRRTELPEYVLDKWKAGKIRPAHFADICRLDLLARYGGVWMDATDFLPAPIPEAIMREPFFVYMSGNTLRGSYSFVQNCFIRAERGNFLVTAWRDAVLEYWKREEGAADYFIHQMIFHKLVECNSVAASHFERMPRICQDPTHVLWFEKGAQKYSEEEFLRISGSAAFQKTEYKSKLSVNPPAGSYAWRLLNFREDKGTGN